MDENKEEQSAIKFTELEVQRLNLNPGDVLMATVKHEDVTEEGLQFLHKKLQKVFSANQVMIFAMGEEGYVKFTVASKPEVAYCSNCNCGKKEAVERAPESGD